MPDLTQVMYFHCCSAEFWETQIKSKTSNEVYTIRYDSISHKNRDVQYDYSCTCKAYKMRKGYCKHILEAKKQHCNWQQFIDGDTPLYIEGEAHCPICNESAIPCYHGV